MQEMKCCVQPHLLKKWPNIGPIGVILVSVDGQLRCPLLRLSMLFLSELLFLARREEIVRHESGDGKFSSSEPTSLWLWLDSKPQKPFPISSLSVRTELSLMRISTFVRFFLRFPGALCCALALLERTSSCDPTTSRGLFFLLCGSVPSSNKQQKHPGSLIPSNPGE